MNQLSLARKRLIKWCVGQGVDLGCGQNKIKEDAIGIDKQNYPEVDVITNVFSKLPFEDNCFDYVFSSHCLEDAEPDAVDKILNEWLRILKKNHYLILHMPDKDFYYNIEHAKGNKNHKKDYFWQDVWNILKNKNTQLIHYSRHGRYDKQGEPINASDWLGDSYGEWSFTIVVEKV